MKTFNSKQFVILSSFAVALAVAVFLSPFASSNPDGLDRVAQDLQFEEKVAEHPPAHSLPFYSIFDEYSLRGIPEFMATPLAGLVGTLAAYGLAWGVGKLTLKRPTSSED